MATTTQKDDAAETEPVGEKKKRARNDYSYDMKLAILNEMVDGGASAAATANKYGVVELSLRNWKKQRATIEKMVAQKKDIALET